MSRQMGILITAAAVISVSNLAQAQCPVAHTHVGKNPTWRPADWGPPPSGAVDTDPTDNNKLWLFALPPVHLGGGLEPRAAHRAVAALHPLPPLQHLLVSNG